MVKDSPKDDPHSNGNGEKHESGNERKKRIVTGDDHANYEKRSHGDRGNHEPQPGYASIGVSNSASDQDRAYRKSAEDQPTYRHLKPRERSTQRESKPCHPSQERTDQAREASNNLHSNGILASLSSHCSP